MSKCRSDVAKYRSRLGTIDSNGDVPLHNTVEMVIGTLNGFTHIDKCRFLLAAAVSSEFTLFPCRGERVALVQLLECIPISLSFSINAGHFFLIFFFSCQNSWTGWNIAKVLKVTILSDWELTGRNVGFNHVWRVKRGSRLAFTDYDLILLIGICWLHSTH